MGKRLLQKLKFVLVEFKDQKVILVSTDLNLKEEEIIKLYASRFQIETMFRNFKESFGGLFYHFWSSSVPKYHKFSKRNDSDPLENIKDGKKQRKILKSVKAIHDFILCNSIAYGIILLLCLKYEGVIFEEDIAYKRTYSKNFVSVSMMKLLLSKNLLSFMAVQPDLTISKIIKSKQKQIF